MRSSHQSGRNFYFLITIILMSLAFPSYLLFYFTNAEWPAVGGIVQGFFFLSDLYLL